MGWSRHNQYRATAHYSAESLDGGSGVKRGGKRRKRERTEESVL